MLWRKIMILSIINILVYNFSLLLSSVKGPSASRCHRYGFTASSLVYAPRVSVAVLGFFSSVSPLAKSFFEWRRGAPDAVQRQIPTRWRPAIISHDQVRLKKKQKTDGSLLYGWMTWGCVLEPVVLTSSETGGRGMRRGFRFLHNATFII